MTRKPDTKKPDPPPPLWTQYRVTWTFLTRVCGSVPADPELVRKWLESRTPRVKPAGALSIEEINEEVVASIARGEGEPDQEYSMLVFQRHNGVLAQRYATVKAHLKDCARVLSTQYIGRVEGEKSFSVRIANGVYLPPTSYWLPFQRPDGTPITHADGAKDKPIHFYVQGRGQMSAIKRFEFIDPPCVLQFTLMVLGRSVSEVDLHHLFEYGGIHGYAGERSDGEGRYVYDFERLSVAAVESAGAAHPLV
jgi:hypothetical protein